MFIWPECIPCILKMSVDIARLSIRQEKGIKAFSRRILAYPAMRGEDWNITSPEVITAIWQDLVRLTKDPDPLKYMKAEQNDKALRMQEGARSRIVASKDPFLAALEMAIAGNALDAMVAVTGSDLKDAENDALPPAIVGAEVLRSRIERARSIVYIIDNCGEVVFDKLFLEVIKATYEARTIVLARGRPILNDATVVEARLVGLDKVAPVRSNGITVPFPGTRLHLVSKGVRRLLAEADLIISKGVGNLDSLTEEAELRGRISFLFQGKCIPCCTPRGLSLGTLVIDNQ